MKRSYRFDRFVILAPLVLTLFGCPPPKDATNGIINYVNKSKEVNQLGITSLQVSCPTGQQLVGGGYNLIPNAPHGIQSIIITGTYPVNKNTWQVDAFDYAVNGQKDSATLLVSCYCYTGGKDLGMRIDSIDTLINVPGAFGSAQTMFTASVNKRYNYYVLTAGGYKVSPSDTSLPDIFVTASFPKGKIDPATKTVDGWSINASALNSASQQHMIVYALSSAGVATKKSFKDNTFTVTPVFDQEGIFAQAFHETATQPSFTVDVLPADGTFSVGAGRLFSMATLLLLLICHFS